jgi:hypothetical protein
MRKKMRLSCLLTGLLLCVAVVIGFNAQSHAATCSEASQCGEARQEQPLQLTTSVVSQRYCEADDEVDALQLELKLRYTNAGSDAIILDKSSGEIPHVMVSRNLEEAKARQYVSDVRLSLYSVEERKQVVYGSSPGDGFVYLAPGASYETEGYVTLTALRGETKLRGHLEAGNYVLQVTTSTWPESESLAKELRVRWRERGVLWYGNVTSEPMSFEVAKNRIVIDCAKSELYGQMKF